ncbi:unnamed protein product [Clonostachys rosea f. rosea IK726]|uniref:Uncharacterized protein n=1 Tax=Clonostachys rosea f. rosea IK726 TaxID=1349383 RepID=A0ACA9T931_BIOOC|nr:unnamed protein product [Clonostachys rosea f. rosea IK726]
MVAIKNLGVAGLLWLSLAGKGLALGIDQGKDGLTLLKRSDAEELYTRDFDGEIYEREFGNIELDTREFPLEVRGGHTKTLVAPALMGHPSRRGLSTRGDPKNIKAYYEELYGKRPSRRGLSTRGDSKNIKAYYEELYGKRPSQRGLSNRGNSKNIKAYYNELYGKRPSR